MTDTTQPKQALSFLFVEDDAFLTDMYSVKFRAAGHTVEVAASGEEALERLRDGFSPSAIIFDLVMPTMDGFELMQTINDEGLKRDALFIVLSNQGEPADQKRARELGAVGHIVKANAIPSEVLAHVERIVAPHGK